MGILQACWLTTLLSKTLKGLLTFIRVDQLLVRGCSLPRFDPVDTGEFIIFINKVVGTGT